MARGVGDAGRAAVAGFGLTVAGLAVGCGSVVIPLPGVQSGAVVAAASVNYGIITTAAGTGKIGRTGNGGLATAASLWTPICITLDPRGNFYIGDLTNFEVREVDGATGIISTYAGGNVYGYSGDNGPATAAQMYGPKACVMDASGNLYLADGGNNVIREVGAVTGVITTIAGNGLGAGTGFGGFAGDGGPATQAEMNQPFGVALDKFGNMYIADTYNNRIRMVATATGLITTVAGNGGSGYGGDGGPATKAMLYNPTGMALDAAGNLYIADSANDVIREVEAVTGVISTVAGMAGSFGFGGDGGAATSAMLDFPQAVAVDSVGDLYIADSGNMRVRRVTRAAGIMQTVVGNGTRGYSGDGGLAISAELDNPYGIAFDASGAMYIADYGNCVVRKVMPAH